MHNQHKYINRPVNKLYALEIHINETITNPELKLIPKNIPTDITNIETNDTSSRPTRIATTSKYRHIDNHCM